LKTNDPGRFINIEFTCQGDKMVAERLFRTFVSDIGREQGARSREQGERKPETGNGK
jgi:hypothetical protein